MDLLAKEKSLPPLIKRETLLQTNLSRKRDVPTAAALSLRQAAEPSSATRISSVYNLSIRLIPNH